MGEFEPIPYRIWIGVTGHRDAAPDPRIDEQVRAVMARVRTEATKAGFPDVRFGVISALAEGPDQYVARAVLTERDALLAAVLPMPADDYRKSLADEASRVEFDRLLSLACDIREFEPGTAPSGRFSGHRGGPVELPLRDGDGILGTDGYSAAGAAIIEHCDVLVAILDRTRPAKRGGTAAVVAQARQHRHAPVVYCIDPHTFDLEVDRRVIDVQGLRRTARLNKKWAGNGDLGWPAEIRRAAQAPGVGVDAGVVEPLLSWATPMFSRADSLAVRLRWWERSARLLLFLGSAAAVTLAAIGLTYAPDLSGLRIVELAVLVLVFGSVVLARRRRWHVDWLAYRALAENVRSLFFANLVAAHVGSGSAVRRGGPARFLTENRWVSHMGLELVVRFPGGRPGRCEPRALGALLAQAWLDPQISYYAARESRSRSTESVFTWTIAALFVATGLAVAVHLADPASWHHRGDRILALLAIVIPAVGGALGGLRDSDARQRHAERSRHMAQRLGALREQMESARTFGALLLVALRTWQQLTMENAEWFDLMRFRELELHV
jgi:hypothetical protein